MFSSLRTGLRKTKRESKRAPDATADADVNTDHDVAEAQAPCSKRRTFQLERKDTQTNRGALTNLPLYSWPLPP